jgi:hypothetical protein
MQGSSERDDDANDLIEVDSDDSIDTIDMTEGEEPDLGGNGDDSDENERGENGGENIAVGYETLDSVMEGWINSPGHRENLLDPRYVDFGEGHIVGTYRGSSAIYWTQNFGLGGNCHDAVAGNSPSGPVQYIDASDPRFDTCREAKSNGYGPYYFGIDAEYDWYRDRDSDGLVCE